MNVKRIDSNNYNFENQTYNYKLSVCFGEFVINLFEPNLTKKNSIIEKAGIKKYPKTHDLQGSHVLIPTPDKPIFTKKSQDILMLNSDDTEVLNLEHKISFIQGSVENESFIKQVPHILYTLCEKTKQLNGQATMHAAAVELPNSMGSALILGPKGSGKTITAMELCINHGCKLIGDDYVIVGLNKDNSGLYTHGGTQNLKVRTHVVKQYFDNMPQSVSNKEPDFQEKNEINLSNLGIETYSNKSPIKYVVSINVHSASSGNKVDNVENMKVQGLRLNENLARFISGQTTPVSLADDGSLQGYFQSMDSAKATKARQNIIDRFQKNIPFEYITAKSPQDSARLMMNRVLGLE